MKDFLIVGSGLFGSTCARILCDNGFSVDVIEKRDHIGGNVFTKKIDGIDVHIYGAHIFHTSNERVWSFINRFATFNSFVNSPLANYRGEIYHLPFNMNTFKELWPDVKTPEDAQRHIDNERKTFFRKKPKNLEEQAINLVGFTVFEKLIKEYTEKQWGKSCDSLPPSIIRRVPVRFTFNNNYFDDVHQGIPIDGYTSLINNMLSGIPVSLSTDYESLKNDALSNYRTIIYTGPIDEFFDYCYGELEYRSLIFKTKRLEIESFQDNAVVNYTSHEKKYTRIIEHKFFTNIDLPYTIITKEYPSKWSCNKDRFYTVNDEKNSELYAKYLKLSKENPRIIFGGRLGLYKYFDMDDTIENAMDLCDRLMQSKGKI